MRTRVEVTSDQLEAVRDLLPALAGTLDVSEMFQHLSSVAARIIPHDEANLALLSDDGSQFREYVGVLDEHCIVSRANRCPFRNLIEPQLVNNFPGDGPIRAGLSAPVRIKDQAFGVLALLAHSPGLYSNEDLTLVRWLADCLTIGLCHHRLSETARRAAVEQQRVATAESLMELLRAISGVLDVRTVFRYLRSPAGCSPTTSSPCPSTIAMGRCRLKRRPVMACIGCGGL